MTYSRKLWRHQCLHFTSAQDFPTAHPVSGKSHSSGVWLNPTNLRCDHHRCWWDIIRIHRATYCTGKMYISTQAHTNMHSLFTLGTFSCGSTVIIWWFRLVPGGGCEAPHVKQWKKDRWYRPWMVCLTSATHKQKWYFSRDEGAICVKADRDTHTQKKKETRKMRAADALSHPDIQFWSQFCLSDSNLCSSNPWKQTSTMAWWNDPWRIGL